MERSEPHSLNRSFLNQVRRFLYKLADLVARSGLIEVLFVSTLVLSRYYKNMDFSYPSEVIVPIALLGMISAGFYYVFRMLLKSVLAAHLAALAQAYFLYSFSYTGTSLGRVARALLPGSFETPFTVSVLMVFVSALVFGLFGWGVAWVSHRKRLAKLQIPKILVFFVLFIFASQAVKVGARLFEIRDELGYRHETTYPDKKVGTSVTKPNIYYLVLDRYASDTTLERIYGYNNSAFTDFLAHKGFVTRQDAYANYPFTAGSISSTLAMGYHTGFGAFFGGDDYQTAFPYRSILNDPPVAKILKQEGYTYNQVSSWWDFTRVGIKADADPTKSFRLTLFGTQLYLSDLSRDIVNKSILSPWLKKGISFGTTPVIKYDRDNNPHKNFEEQIRALKTLSSSESNAPQFTFAHFLSPHDPYIFDENGQTPTYDSARTDNGKDEYVKYIQQLTYINKRMQDVIETIRSNDPGAVVIMQADEGPYPKEFRGTLSPTRYYDPINLDVAKMRQKYGVLASYYMPDMNSDKVATELVSSVDAFRFVLANYLGYDLPMLPDCNYSAGNKYKLYNYQLVTSTLKGGVTEAPCEKR